MFNKKISVYLIITFLITWGSWFTVVALLGESSLRPPLFILYVFGGFGPTISAFITKKLLGEKNEFKSFLKQIIQVKESIIWYILIAIAPLVLTFVPWLINLVITGKQQMIIQQPIYMLFAMIPVMVIGGGLEELGWRGVFLPELLKKHSVLVSTIFVALTWTAWHIPLWFIRGVSQYGSNFIEFAFSVIGLTCLLSILYIKTKSIFMCIMFHSLVNAYMAIFSTQCLDTLSETINILVKFLICAVILIVFLTTNKKNVLLNKEIIDYFGNTNK